eukprot:bmy_19334T0
MFQLALDLPACESLGPGPEFRLLPRLPHRPPRVWSFKSGQPARVPAPVWSPRPPRLERGHSHGQMLSPRARRAHRPRDQVAALGPKAGLAKPPAAAKSSPSLGSSSSSSSSAGGSGAPTDQQALLRRGKRHLQGPAFSSFDFRGSRPTTETEFIAWGPTGEEEAPESNTFPGVYGPTKVSIFQTRKTAVATATATATATTATSVTLQTQGVTEPLDPRSGKPVGVSTTEPSTSPSRDSGKVSKPPRVLGETSESNISVEAKPSSISTPGAGGRDGGTEASGITVSPRRKTEKRKVISWALIFSLVKGAAGSLSQLVSVPAFAQCGISWALGLPSVLSKDFPDLTFLDPACWPPAPACTDTSDAFPTCLCSQLREGALPRRASVPIVIQDLSPSGSVTDS